MPSLSILDRYKNLEPLILGGIFIIIYSLTFNGLPHYDVVRNLIVAQEIQQRGIPTYFDSAYWQHPPLLPYLTATLGSILNISLYSAGMIVILSFSFASLFIFYKLCLALRDKSFARISTVLLGVTPVFWVWSNEIMHEVPQTFFFMTTVYFFYLGMKHGQARHFYISGFFLGGALLTKSQAVIVIPVILAFAFVEGGKGVFHDKRLLKNIFVMFAIAGITFSPYFIYRTMNNAPLFFGEKNFEELLSGKASWSGTGDISQPVYYYLLATFDIISFSIVFFLIGIYRLYKNRDKSMQLPVIWIAFSYILLSIFAHKEYRFMILAIPSMVMVSVYGLYGLRDVLKNRKYLYAIVALLTMSLALHSAYLVRHNVQWPAGWGMWAELQGLNNSVLSTDLNKYSTVKMSYGMVKLMTGKYSDLLPAEQANGISFALMYNTPYLLYDGKPEFSYPLIKMKYFGECNCTLYKVDENILFENKTLIKTASGGKLLDGVNIYILDLKGNIVYRSKSNINGEVFLPIENYTGILVADKICFNPIQTYVNIENRIFKACSLKQRTGAFGVTENYLECEQKASMDIPYKGCFDNDYQMSRF